MGTKGAVPSAHAPRARHRASRTSCSGPLETHTTPTTRFDARSAGLGTRGGMDGGTRFFFPRRQHQHQGGRPKLRHREVLVDARHRLRDGIAIAGVGTLGTLGTHAEARRRRRASAPDDRSNRVFQTGHPRFETAPL